MIFVYLLPVALLGIAWALLHKKLDPRLLLIPLGVCWLFTFVSTLVQESGTTDAVEYNGFYYTEVAYYEYWETWVEKTCSREYACGEDCSTDSNGNRSCTTVYCTEYYDCSYCDENPAYWTATLNNHNSVRISESEYLKYKKLWGNNSFKDLNRRINKHRGCGIDGDKWFTKWDGDLLTAREYTNTVNYKNYLRLDKSLFNYSAIDSTDALKLYERPNLKGGFQNTVLGGRLSKEEVKKLNFFNAYYGTTNKMRYYTLFFENQDISVAKLQEALWLGGNQNEVVVCIGKSGGKTDWVFVFSWCDNKMLHVFLREELMKPDADIYCTYISSLEHYRYKDFEDFNYISFEPSEGQMRFNYISAVFVTLISLFVIVKMSES